MTENLIQQVKSLFGDDKLQTISNNLGESHSSVSNAIKGIIPALFGSLISRANTAGGADEIAREANAQEGNAAGFMDNAGNLVSGNNNLNAAFGNDAGIGAAIARFAGIKPGSASALAGIAGTAIMGFLGNYMNRNNIAASGLAGLLNSQKDHVQAEMPAGLSSIMNTGVAPMTAVADHTHVAQHADHYSEHVPVDAHGGGSGLKWLLPVLLFALIAAGALYFFKNKNNSADAHGGAHAGHDSSMVNHNAATGADSTGNTAGMGMVDSSGNYVYNVGAMKQIVLPNNAGTLTVGENSTEAKLVAFLQGNEAIDTAKGNWFDFTNVYFNTGSSTITDASMAQLQNMVAIAKAFPTAQFKIGGYTDNTGDEAKNISLSKSRAAAVAAKLKSMGATSASIVSSDGYGSQFAIGDNSTVDGRAKNRRVSVNVKAR